MTVPLPNLAPNKKGFEAVAPPAYANEEKYLKRKLREDQIPWRILLVTYWGFFWLWVVGLINEYATQIYLKITKKKSRHATREGFAPLVSDFNYFYMRHMYGIVRDCWDRPIGSRPGATFEYLERYGVNKNEYFVLTGERKEVLNLSSYNYLGFAEHNDECVSKVIESIEKYGVSPCSPQAEIGYCDVHKELERVVAKHVGKEAALIFAAGFGTNATSLQSLVGKGGLIISDSLNHASLVVGSRASGAKIKTFKHNDVKNLEKVLRESIVEGQPRTGRAWKKILIVVEGIYSMEGEMCPLPEIVALKKKYKAYLYVDEAHSIGAIGPTGRGICEHKGVDPADVDILMGTFTKSFGSIGGYIASSRDVIEEIKRTSFGTIYDTQISAGCAQQVISAFKIISGEDGTNQGQIRLKNLKDNSNYLRKELIDLGFHVLGDWDSPIIPLLLYTPSKVPAFSRNLLEDNIGVVVVGFPATPFYGARARLCISASHTREQLQSTLPSFKRIGDKCLVRFGEE